MDDPEICSACGQPKRKLGFFKKMVYWEYSWKVKLFPKLMPFPMCSECKQKNPEQTKNAK